MNRALVGYEWYLARAAAREHLEAYLNSTLYCDPSVGEGFVFEVPIEDERAWWGKKTQQQQERELDYIKNHLLEGAILGATEGRPDATGRDAEVLRVLRERWGG